MLKNFLEIGQIVGTHGVKGELRVNAWCDDANFFINFTTLYWTPNDEFPIRLVAARPHGNIVLCKLEGIESIQAASSLRNKVLYIKREDAKLANGSYFIQELIDCSVFDVDTGKKYGILVDVSKTGANDVWHIKDERNEEYLIPAIDEVVVRVDIVSGKIEIRPMKGIFADEN